AMLISDIFIGFYHVPVMLTVYASLAALVFIGRWIKEIKPYRLLAASLASSTFFFLTTNFAVWATGDWYPKTAAGLLWAYEMGIPFFRNMMLGDLIYTGALFGVWAVLTKFYPFLIDFTRYNQSRKIYINFTFLFKYKRKLK
ncbi:MAG: DUF6580 family putative transport protein, partial [Nitrososphaerota archaeon]